MNYTGSVFGYYFKNFFYVALVMGVPAVFIGLTLNPYGFVDFFVNYLQTPVNDFNSLFLAVTSFNWVRFGCLLTAVLFLTVFGSLLFGKIEKHFRTGKMSFISSGGELNNNAVAMLKTVLMLVFSTLIFLVLECMIFLLVHFCFAGIGNTGNLTSLIINLAAALFVALFYLQTLNLIFAANADMIIMGSPFIYAYRNASRMVSKSAFRMFFCLLLPFIITCLLSAGGALLGIFWLSNILGLLLIFPMLIIISLMLFFNYNNIVREDLRKIY